MALVKAIELRAKLSGLLIDRIEVVTVDLKGASEEARSRVFDITPLPRQPCAELGPVADLAVSGSAYRGLGVPGNPLGD